MTQGEALAILKTGANVFLTGEPGSGKTHTINAYTDWLRASGVEPSVTAATGIAATHVSGMTLHSWSGIGIAEYLSEADVDRIASKEHIARRIQKAKVLIIDEVSMLSAATFQMADAVCREVRRTARPFGGLQVVLVGDFFQLPPVAKRGQAALFAYESAAWREANPLVCYLDEQHRQDDEAFLSVLSAIRRNEVDEAHFEHLSSRRIGLEDVPADAPKLYSHNADVDRINAERLAQLPGSPKRYRMKSSGGEAMVDGLKRGCLSPETLDLKEGAAVMFTKNSPQGKFVNGTLGTVVGFEPGTGLPAVETRDGMSITADPMEWQVEENGKVRAQITQVPLRLAWAMTVHKSQGQSLDEAVIDLSQAFEYGQGYVALSRVRRLSGLHLLGMNRRALEVHPEILEKDIELRDLSRRTAATFAVMPSDELKDMQKRFVKAMGGAWFEGERSPSARKGKKSLAGRLAETLEAVRDAKSLDEAAKARGFTRSTIVKHLEELAEAGMLERADFAHLLPGAEARAEIEEAFATVGGERLSPIFSMLKGEYDFETLRLVRLAAD